MQTSATSAFELPSNSWHCSVPEPYNLVLVRRRQGSLDLIVMPFNVARHSDRPCRHGHKGVCFKMVFTPLTRLPFFFFSCIGCLWLLGFNTLRILSCSLLVCSYYSVKSSNKDKIAKKCMSDRKISFSCFNLYNFIIVN